MERQEEFSNLLESHYEESEITSEQKRLASEYEYQQSVAGQAALRVSKELTESLKGQNVILPCVNEVDYLTNLQTGKRQYFIKR